MSAILTTEALTYEYGDRRVVDDVNLVVEPGRAYGLLGPNGAGKTTTVRLTNGLLTPTQGAVTLFGERLTTRTSSALRQHIGVQTDTELYATLSARENLEVWGGLFGMAGASLKARVDEILGMMSLDHRADSLVGSFSKGMRQKLAVGRALLPGPRLLFLDEPTAGLDPEATEDLIDDLTALMRDTDLTVIIATHQLHGLEQLCSDLGVLVGGRLVAQGPIDDLIRERWPRTRVRISTEARAASVLPGSIAESDGVAIETTGPDEVSAAVAALVGAGLPVRAVVPQHPTVQDLYFAITEEAAA